MNWKEALNQSDAVLPVTYLGDDVDTAIYTDGESYTLRTPWVFTESQEIEEIEERLTSHDIPLNGWR
jgi:hypothetical protein